MSISNRQGAQRQERLNKLSSIAGAAGALGADANAKIQEKLDRALTKLLEEDERAEAAIIESRRAHLESIRQDTEAVKKMQADCSHLKQDRKSTRLGGQRVGAPGNQQQICLVCSACGKEYHFPVKKEGQEAPPAHLIPEMDMIGGQLT